MILAAMCLHLPANLRLHFRLGQAQGRAACYAPRLLASHVPLMIQKPIEHVDEGSLALEDAFLSSCN